MEAKRLIAQTLDTRFSATADEAERFTSGTLPNGLASDTDGSLLISNFGTDRLERMTRDGRTEVLLDRIDGEPVGKVNFVLRDSCGRAWITVSTRITNWMAAISPNIADGYVAVLDEQGPRIVADGFATQTRSVSMPPRNGAVSSKPAGGVLPACGSAKARG